jgi:hypothetical protein
VIEGSDKKSVIGTSMPDSINLTRIGQIVRLGCVWDSAERTVVYLPLAEVLEELGARPNDDV